MTRRPLESTFDVFTGFLESLAIQMEALSRPFYGETSSRKVSKSPPDSDALRTVTLTS